MQSRPENIYQRLDDLERRVAQLERDAAPFKRYGEPSPDRWPHQPPENKCSKCGLKLEGVMGYCCPNPGCPTGLGSPTC
jgi:hypothetical protein